MNAFGVILAEHADGTGMRLEIQRALEFDEQDRATGMDTYCLCTERGATHYGGVVSWRLEHDVLEVLLDEQASAELETNGFRVGLSLERDTHAVLRAGLVRVFGSGT